MRKSFSFLAGNNLILGMWGVNAAAPLNMVHLGYGFGAIFANFLVRPFLGSENLQLNNLTGSSSLMAVPLNSNIQIPYTISAILCFLVGIGHLLFFIRTEKSRREKIEIKQVCRVFAPYLKLSSVLFEE